MKFFLTLSRMVAQSNHEKQFIAEHFALVLYQRYFVAKISEKLLKMFYARLNKLSQHYIPHLYGSDNAKRGNEGD